MRARCLCSLHSIRSMFESSHVTSRLRQRSNHPLSLLLPSCWPRRLSELSSLRRGLAAPAPPRPRLSVLAPRPLRRRRRVCAGLLSFVSPLCAREAASASAGPSQPPPPPPRSCSPPPPTSRRVPHAPGSARASAALGRAAREAAHSSPLTPRPPCSPPPASTCTRRWTVRVRSNAVRARRAAPPRAAPGSRLTPPYRSWVGLHYPAVGHAAQPVPGQLRPHRVRLGGAVGDARGAGGAGAAPVAA